VKPGLNVVRRRLGKRSSSSKTREWLQGLGSVTITWCHTPGYLPSNFEFHALPQASLVFPPPSLVTNGFPRWLHLGQHLLPPSSPSLQLCPGSDASLYRRCCRHSSRGVPRHHLFNPGAHEKPTRIQVPDHFPSAQCHFELRQCSASRVDVGGNCANDMESRYSLRYVW